MIYKRFLISMFGLLLLSCTSENNKFNKESFNNKKYSEEQIKLFCDICFRESNTLRKWETDINVEIKDIDSLNHSYISDVDSCIAILSPLIKPLKIKKIKTNGNLTIFFMDRLPPRMRMAFGYCKSNNLWLSSEINNVELDILKNQPNSKTLLHEMEHALGLAHPRRKYSYILNIAGKDSPSIYKTIDEYEEYSENRYPISKQEKEVIKMLYGGDFTSGLKQSTFMKSMGLKNDEIWDKKVRNAIY